MALSTAEPLTTSTELLLSHTDCQRILAKACGSETNLQLKEFTLKPAAYTSGFLGEYYHLVVHYSVAVPDENKNLADRRQLHELHAFVKGIPQANEEPEKEAIFRKEAALYGTLLERLRPYATVAWSPRCFFARNDLIVLEQLDPLNYKLCPESNEYLNDHYLCRVLRALAAQHAASLALEVKEGICIGDIYPQLQQEITVSPQVPWYTVGLRAILAVVKSQLKSQTPALRAAVESRLPDVVKSVFEMTNRWAKYRNVLCHRDIWRGNILYSETTSGTSCANNSSVILVDYQTARYCPPAIDVVFTLFMNLDKATRKAKELEYLCYYYDFLQRDCGANGFAAADQVAYSELLASYQEFQLFGLLYRAIATTILKVPRECVTNEYVHVDRTAMVFKLMSELPELRICLEESIQEMIDLIIEQKV
ncbi:uncharacterized protein LOC129248459 [Anastrepha obliqua]|uniref:uncharacterized protein LOC129248459 n=1 Tax=Anastrepha obliqua TaxID=95512 RepID=UPI002409ECDF|nr:uncharacterized protein LOC129248459 [Anastrepha obliqua]